MNVRGNDYDVSAQIRTTDPTEVNTEVDRIYLALYPGAAVDQIDRAFADLNRLFRGEYPGYHACDTEYHDLQHTLEVTLAMARLLDGYERGPFKSERFGPVLTRLGVIVALFHDCGYIRELSDQAHKNGAEYTLTHVSRGAAFLRSYLPTIGMAALADIAVELVHFTGFEKPVSAIALITPTLRLLGSMLGSADIIAQMADRCYLEKCRDRLYPEFLAGGIAIKRSAEGEEQVLFSSGEDLVMKTPVFMEGAMKRLDSDLNGCYTYAQHHFGGENPYLDEAVKNIAFAREIRDTNDFSPLRRNPPQPPSRDSDS
jgi:hypothetical protein